MSKAWERIDNAMDVLSSTSGPGTLQEQTERCVGEIDEEEYKKLRMAVEVLIDYVFQDSLKRSYDPILASHNSMYGAFLIGLQLGKRLGVEDGMKMPRVDV